jgi:hypothetical protein
MEESSSPTTVDVEKLAKAIRFALVVFVAGVSFMNIRWSLGIPNFDVKLVNLAMLSFPAKMFLAVVMLRPFIIGLAIVVPVAAMACLLTRRLVPSIYFLGWLAVATFAQFALYLMFSNSQDVMMLMMMNW